MPTLPDLPADGETGGTSLGRAVERRPMSVRGLAPADLRGARAVVMGLGRFGGGAGAALHLVRNGASVVGTDLRSAQELPEAVSALAGSGVELVLGRHDERDFERADLVVANPAVRPDHPLLVGARSRGARVATEIELFVAASHGRHVGITGTQGKSSTTSFVAELLRAGGARVFAGGNLGGSLLERVDDVARDDWVVLELSSYQLEHLGDPPAGARTFRAAAVTNVELDHLERHGGLAGYARAKRRVLELAADDADVWLPSGSGPTEGWTRERGAIRRFDPRASDGDVALADGGVLPGPSALGLPSFQAANLRLAYGIAHALGVGVDDLRAAAPRLRPPSHRFERLDDLRGATVVDNGVSTTPDSTASALLALAGPVVLLVGGRLKDLPLHPLLAAARGRVRRAFAFGESAGALASALGSTGIDAVAAGTLERAVSLAVGDLRRGDALLFSPACASFDAHANFEDRAKAFRRTLEASRATYEEGRAPVS
ncbi:MAG: UDP-N-acetylmuramoyl-L-alanine--D-glutamate ligase [Planctomycetota bacterium]